MQNHFQPVVTEKTSRSQRIVLQIRELLADGKLKAGDKLPPERELANMFNVSRTSVREAIRTLSAMGLVEIKKGYGVFMKEANLDSVISNVADALILSKEEMKQLFEIRKVLETQAAAWAALRASEDEIEELETIISEVKSSKKRKLDLALAREYDERFHGAIIKASHNVVLVKIMSGLFDVLDKVRTKTAIVPGRAAQSINDHEAIAKAIAERDAPKAMQAMYEHIESVEKTIEK
ncbi:FadR/GntR family transcriptional regulator [Desulfoscipio geothermicus]|uniref:GntR family transcriptional regulator, transcriptional repressor for pyruvate dehydrogenase complex n=1 Tax=Desulfoscipio geothermicus DSM 3669 TaxID=1121426 RepID=A0A1I6DYW5_9FIRM|nr:FadR/GntR family transcriptional regulator [Desulfoscipio geothermicus]SFR10616.1 GntR family transcriptional regulator, transcriptional repressor for pyruvate dehydrogenase complex [Desulfoscipio geothermicus DSM 3669]